MALIGGTAANRRRGNHVVISGIEHASVLETADYLERQGFRVTRLMPDSWGHISKEQLLEAVTPETILVSCMLVNNELGSVLPVLECAGGIKRKNPDVLLHCDAVQAFGKMPLHMERYPIDLCTVTAHKIHGPKGVGALMIAKNSRILPLFYGGSQQKKIRPGTESSHLIAGFGAACEEAKRDLSAAGDRVSGLREQLREGLQAFPDIQWLSPLDASPYVVSLRVSTIRSETLLHFLEERDVFVSSGSACAKGQTSHVLRAIGLRKEQADSVIRVSFSKENDASDIQALLEGLQAALSQLARR